MREPTPTEVLAELEQIKGSRAFVKSDMGMAILEYLVRKKLAGAPMGDFKEISIGCQVYGSDYDPKASPKVRTAVGRLRASLDAYYQNEGGTHQVRIGISTEYYVPEFTCLPSPECQLPGTSEADISLSDFSSDVEQTTRQGLEDGRIEDAAEPRQVPEGYYCPHCYSENIKHPNPGKRTVVGKIGRTLGGLCTFVLPKQQESELTDYLYGLDNDICRDCGTPVPPRPRSIFKMTQAEKNWIFAKRREMAEAEEAQSPKDKKLP